MTNHKAPIKTTTETTSTVQNNPVPPKKSVSYLLTSVLILLIFLTISSTGYLYYLQENLQQQLQNHANDLTKQLESVAHQLDNSAQHEITQEKQIQQQETQLNLLEKKLQETRQQQTYDKKDWLLLKARYYLELAEANAYWSTQTESSIALLKQADQLLATIPDQAIFPVRQAIAQDISMLETIAPLDITGLLSQLDAIQTNLIQLPLKQSATELLAQTKKEKLAHNTSDSNAWSEHLKTTLTHLEKLVVIQRHDSMPLPLLSPEQEALLRNGVRLNLQEAQWAILQGNEALYQWALSAAEKTIKQQFAQNSAQTQTTLRQLNTLSQTKLIQPKVSIQQALRRLNTLIESHSEPAHQGENP